MPEKLTLNQWQDKLIKAIEKDLKAADDAVGERRDFNRSRQSANKAREKVSQLSALCRVRRGNPRETLEHLVEYYDAWQRAAHGRSSHDGLSHASQRAGTMQLVSAHKDLVALANNRPGNAIYSRRAAEVAGWLEERTVR